MIYDNKEIYDSLFNKDNKIDIDNNKIPKLKQAYKNIRDFKNNIPTEIKTPVGIASIRIKYVFAHMKYCNSTKVDRTRFNGNFLDEISNPSMIIRNLYGNKINYYFFTITKNKDKILFANLHCFEEKNGKLEHKTFFPIKKGFKKIKRLIENGVIMHCHKLPTKNNLVQIQEQVHYSNASGIVQKENKKVNSNIKFDINNYPKNKLYFSSNINFDKFEPKYVNFSNDVYGYTLSSSKDKARENILSSNKNIKIDDISFLANNVSKYVKHLINKNNNDITNALNELKEQLSFVNSNHKELMPFFQQAYILLDRTKDNIKLLDNNNTPNGITYTVQTPHKRFFLKEEAYILSQSKEIKELINNIDEKNFPNIEVLNKFKNNKCSAKEFYNELSLGFEKDVNKKSSKYLYNQGIKGIINKNEEYILFSKDDIKIIDKTINYIQENSNNLDVSKNISYENTNIPNM